MKVKMFSDKNPENLEFGKLGAEVVLECTGVFLTQEKAKVHLKDGVKKVVFSALPKTSTGKIQKFELRKKAKELN